MKRTVRLLALLAVAVIGATGCTSDGEATADPNSPATPSAEASVPTGMVQLETDVGGIAHPEEWKPADQPPVKDLVATLLITDESGATVGQMDVMVNAVPEGSAADAVNAANQGARAANFRDLRHVRREFVDVPGAASAYLNESTYTTAEGAPAHSIERLAIAENGDLMLARISSAEDAYDAALFEQVLTSMRLTGRDSA